MSAKRIQLADGTWQALDLFSRDSTKTFQERADESLADLLAKPGRPFIEHQLEIVDFSVALQVATGARRDVNSSIPTTSSPLSRSRRAPHAIRCRCA